MTRERMMTMKFNDLAVRGIDISGYNGAIDWAKVKASSHFVIIRAGYGNTTDKTFLANWKNASVPKAAYWYMDYYSNWYNKESKAYGLSDVAFGLLQANYCWELLKGDPGGSIVWLDIESGGADYSPNITSSPAAGHAQAIAKAFLMEMDRLNGRKNGIYCSVGLLTWFDKWFRDRPLWVAWYTKTQTVDSVLKAVKARGWEGETMMWQYASDGDIDEDGKGDGKQLGSSYNWLDLNVWIGDDADWLNWKNGGVMDIKPLAQGDARWGGDKLGTSNTTISGYGCLITCVTMMLNHLGWAETPGTLNVKLRDNGGYHNGNLFVWGSLSALYPGVKFAYRYSGSATDKINASLAAGMPVIVHVDYNPSTPAIDEHWVLVVGRQGDDYIINDPKDGKQLLFSTRYGVASKNIHTVCTYNFSGIVPPVEPEPEPSPIEAGQVVATLVNLNIRKGAGTKYGVWATAPKGTKLDVLEIKGDWVRVGWQQWCMSNYNGVRYLG